MDLSSFPHLVKEWHPTKNGDLRPEDVTHGSHKKVWWLCPKGHSYYSVVSNRTKNSTSCPYCSGNKVGDDNNLEFLHPEIAKEWHPTKNGKLTPRDITPNSTKRIWWLCSNGHSYDAKSNVRVSMKTNCPYCSGRRVGEDNNLEYVYPEIAKEWHPLKNGNRKPTNYTSRSDTKVWWLCPNQHSYEAVIKNRTLNSSRCPYCSNQTSEPELRILSELKVIFDEVKNREKIDGVEVDIYIPEVNLAIEYDGKYWHKDNEDSDIEKNKFLLSQDINLIRVREHPLESLTENDIVVRINRSLEKTDLDKILKKIYPFVDNSTKEKINAYLRKSSFANDELFKKYRSYFPSPFPEKSILKTHPELSEEWDYDKNYPLTPKNFSYGSGKMIWWLCPKGHSYERSPNTRTSHGIGCPYCSGRKTLNYDLFK
jgi:very-short-patch-repair endonuclease/uncharacterized Zn-finger protein